MYLMYGTRMLLLTLPLSIGLPKHFRSVLNQFYTEICRKVQDISKSTSILSKKRRKVRIKVQKVEWEPEVNLFREKFDNKKNFFMKQVNKKQNKNKK